MKNRNQKLKRISIKDISIPLPDLKNSNESKFVTVGNWIIDFINNDKCAKANHLLPLKPELAYFLGVSTGTLQNALIYVEDLGYVETKQSVGTIIKDRQCATNPIRKLTSKREIAINALKKYIQQNNFKQGDNLPPAAQVSREIGFSQTTTKLAMIHLCTMNMLEHKFRKSKDAGWIIKSTDFEIKDIKEDTLVEQIENDLQEYIINNLKIGDRIPSLHELSKLLSVSVATIHEGVKKLISNGILLARRGRYGTTVIKMPNENSTSSKKENSIFASAPDAAFYYYEKIQEHIKKMIIQNYKIGDKLPSVNELSDQLDVSTSTIRRSLHDLAEEGYLAFSRGRYGGTFVIDIPEEQSFKWLSVNPEYAKVYNKSCKN